jgi:hypothetical protein
MLVNHCRLSATVWSAHSNVPLLDLVFATVRKQIDDVPVHPPGAPGPFALADTEAVKKHFIQAGFKVIRIDMLQTTFDSDSPDSYTFQPRDYCTHSGYDS